MMVDLGGVVRGPGIKVAFLAGPALSVHTCQTATPFPSSQIPAACVIVDGLSQEAGKVAGGLASLEQRRPEER